MHLFASNNFVDDFLLPLSVAVVILGVPALIRFLYKLTRDVRDIKSLLVTAKPTPLVPNPPLGLVDTVAALAKDARPDNGKSSRDVLNRIEEATGATPRESK